MCKVSPYFGTKKKKAKIVLVLEKKKDHVATRIRYLLVLEILL